MNGHLHTLSTSSHPFKLHQPTNDVLALLFDWDIVPKVLGMISLCLVQDLIVRVDPLYAQLLAEVRSDSGDVGQRIALVNDALNVGVGVSAGVDGVNHISDVEA